MIKARKGNFFSDTSQKWPFHSVLVISHWFGFCPLLIASQLLRSLKLAFSSAAPADAENGKIKLRKIVTNEGFRNYNCCLDWFWHQHKVSCQYWEMR